MDIEFDLPFFSVIMTTYNRANVLRRALNSLITQTEKDWEAVIIDDGSRDDTPVQVLPYLGVSTKISYIRQANQGDARAKNTGILSSTGKFITFLDSDDEFSPKHLETRKAILVRNPVVEFLYGGAEIIGNQYVPDRRNCRKKIHLSDCVIGGTFFIRRNIATSFHGFNRMPIGYDADFFERISNTSTITMKTDLPTYIYHHENVNSITNNLLAGSDPIP